MNYKIASLEKFHSQETPTIFTSAGFNVDEFVSIDPNDRMPLLTYLEQANPHALLVGFKHRLDREALEKAPNLKVVATRSTGLDHIDLVFCKEKDIEVLSLRGETDFLKEIPATAELTFLKMGELLRRDRHELKGRVLGIIGGRGRVGLQMCVFARTFDMKVIWSDKNRPLESEWVLDEFAEIEDLLKKSDIISLHITADEENRNFMDLEKFKLMKDGAYFLNSARGWLVDSESLEWALDNKLAGAWCDFNMGFEHPKLMWTDHQAGSTIESWVNTEKFMANKLVQYLLTLEL